MAAPNVVNVGTILAKTNFATPANTTPNILLVNPANSNKVFKVNMIQVANIDGAVAYDATVAINTTAAGNGTSFALISTASVPADAALIVTDKSTAFYLEENESVLVTSSSANKLTFITSFEEIS